MKKETKMILLAGWFILCTVLYFAAVNFEFTPIMPIYMAMSLIFGISFFLVNGGIRPTVKTENTDSGETLTKKQKARMRYHRESALSEKTDNVRPNIFNLTPEKQKMLSELFLILFLAPTAVLCIDYILIAFVPGYN